MNFNRFRSIAAIFILIIISGCVDYPGGYGDYSRQMGNGYGYGGARQAQYGNVSNRNYQQYQQYQPYRGQGEYREHEHEGRGYGQYRRHDDD